MFWAVGLGLPGLWIGASQKGRTCRTQVWVWGIKELRDFKVPSIPSTVGFRDKRSGLRLLESGFRSIPFMLDPKVCDIAFGFSFVKGSEATSWVLLGFFWV